MFKRRLKREGFSEIRHYGVYRWRERDREREREIDRERKRRGRHRGI